ncbi:MAG: TRAP transporter small permease [Planctomycetota bacterium]|nr:MAG: TRAP transporter small permease [Planctomycetota bacterium]
MSMASPADEPRLPAPLAFLRRLDAKVQRAEVALCFACLALMIALAFAQVFLRLVQGSGLFPDPVPWFETVARHMVIWVGLLGASLATAQGRHISIEALPKLLSSRGRRRVDAITQGAALGVVLLLLAVCSVYMLRLQVQPWLRGGAEPLFSVERLGWAIPRWPFLVVVPLGLALIAWRFALRVLEALLLDDESYARLRAQAEERELSAVERAQENDAVALLLEHPSEEPAAAGKGRAQDTESARAEVRAALGSGRREPEDLLAGPEGDSDELPVRNAARRGQRPPPSIRSTDEIPAYFAHALHDDEDVKDPVMRKGEVVLDSSDLIDVSDADLSTHDTAPELAPHVVPDSADEGDLRISAGDPEAAVEALADSERRRQSESERAEREASRALPPEVTARLPLEVPPGPDPPAHLVVLVRRREAGA